MFRATIISKDIASPRVPAIAKKKINTKNVKVSKPGLVLACCNKSLCNEWKNFLETLDIFGRVIDCKRYREKVSGVRIYIRQSIINFQELGGFVEKVKISRKSKYYCGLTKNEILGRVINTFS